MILDVGSTEEVAAPSHSPRYQDLLNIATLLFARDGYDRTTVRAIADLMGIESGSLYSHIDRKEDLLFSIVRRVAREFFERADAARQQADSSVDLLRRLCRAHMSVMSDSHEACQVYYAEWRKLSPDNREAVVELRERYQQIYRDAIDEGVSNGELQADDNRWATLVVLSALNWSWEWYVPAGRLAADEVADSMAAILLNGIATKRE